MCITFTGQNNYFSSGYYCGSCGEWVLYGMNHICQWYPPTIQSGDVVPIKHYKCPKCKGEFSEPFKKFTGKFKDADIKEIGTEVIIGNTKVPIEKYVCPFCNKEMKGLNQ